MPEAADLVRMTAVEAVDRLKRGEVTPLELVDAAAARIEAVDGAINALPIRCFDRARDRARRLMQGTGREHEGHPAWLAGLPIAIKDLMDVEGLPTTYGCPVFKDKIATVSDPMVRQLELRGALVVAKSNTPEFGMLPITDNRVFGATATPWHTGRTAGGSSGGAAAAVAVGEVWLAHGSDIGGSLRIPAACCGVVGIRPSSGRVPRLPSKRGFSPLAVQGPMARNVPDTALFLDAMSALDKHDPLTLPEEPGRFLAAVRAARPPRRVAFTPDLGLKPVDPEVAAVARKAAATLESMGAAVEDAHPDMGDIGRLFSTLIAFNYFTEREALVDRHRADLEPMHGDLIDVARRLTIDDLAWAQRARAELFERFAAFFEDYDFLLSPTIGTAPFGIERSAMPGVEEWARGEPPGWFQQCWGTVPTACPIVSILAGFTAEGLPVGLQVIGPARADGAVLGTASLIEKALGLAQRLPIEPRG